MPTAIEQNLSTLLPTKSLLPTQLVSLATSLLAQSKASAPKLKAQEEIAREYACAHIACERLANKLALEVGQIIPPCGPRIYNKLHRYLDGVLTAGKLATPARSTPTAKKALGVPSPAVHRSHAAAVSPPKTHVVTPLGGPRKRKIAQVEQDETTEQALPDHLVQLSHHLCRTAGVHQAAPHAYAGLERVYNELDVSEQSEETSQTPSKRARKLTAKAESLLPKNSKISVEPHKLSLVVIAIVNQTLQKMRTAEPTENSADEEQEVLLSEGLSYIRKHDATTADKLNTETLEELSQQVSALTYAMQALPFWHEWMGNVSVLGNITNEEDTASTEEVEDELLPSRAKAKQTPLRRKEKHWSTDDVDDLPGAAGLLPGHGTMFQPAFDWLSEGRQEEYARWERGILDRLATIKTNA